MSMYPLAVGLLWILISTLLWYLKSAGWQENFGVGVLILTGISAAIGIAFYSQLTANSNLGWFYVVGVCVGIITSLLVACPWVCTEKAKETAQKYAQERLGGMGHDISIIDAKLDDWTWHVTGWRISRGGSSVRFCVDIDSKRGKVRSLYYP